MSFFVGSIELSDIFIGEYKTGSPYFSEANFLEYQDLVDSVGSCQFVDSGRRYRFNNAIYIGNRVAINVNGTTLTKINLDTLTVTTTKTLSSSLGRIWRFGENRILSNLGILDFDGNFITTFSNAYSSITPGVEGIVWANLNYDIYKGVVDGDNITFTKVGTGWTDEFAGSMFYGHLGAYLINRGIASSHASTYINPTTNALSSISEPQGDRTNQAYAGADGKLYRVCTRSNYWSTFQKIGTANEGIVGTTTSSDYLGYGIRSLKFLGNIADGGMNSSNGTGTGHGSRNYFVATDGTFTNVQNNPLSYDSSINGNYGFIDENGWIYPSTGGGGSGVILKTDKIFTNLNWKNPYLFR